MNELGSLITDIIKSFSETIGAKVATNFADLNSAVLPVWIAGISVYFIFNIYSMIYQQKDLDVLEFSKHMAVLGLITFFLSVSGGNGVYTKKVIPFVMESGQSLSSLVMGGKGANSLVEALLDKTMTTIKNIWIQADKVGGFDYLGAVVMAGVQTVILIIGGGLLGIFAFVYIVITTLMVGILLSLGGIFIMFAGFTPTRQMFSAWVGSCLNYIFLNVSFSISFSIIYSVIDTYVGGIGTKVNLIQTLAIGLLYFAGILMLQQITTLTSTLTGGVGINGLTSAVRSALPEKTLARMGKATWNKTGGAMAKNTASWGVDVGKSMLGKNNTIRG